MEVDHVTYIFGSFTRRRQSDEHYAAKRRSLEPSALSAGNSPNHLSPARSLTYAQERPGPRALSIAGAISNASTPEDVSFQCSLCKRNFVEPKVLPCLHTFCAKCLGDINKHGSDLSLWNGLPVGSDVTPSGRAEPCSSRSGSCSAGSGYESEPRADPAAGWALGGRMALKPRSSNKFGIFRRKARSVAECQSRKDDISRHLRVKCLGPTRATFPYQCDTTATKQGKNILVLVCPTCGFENRMPQGGVAALPPNFVLQHRMLLAALNKDKSRILCDLCSTDTPAASRCGTCLVNMCAFCREAHGRQRATSGHGVAALRGGQDIARLRRRVMCAAHPDTELKMFCNTCCQVICRDCCLVSHAGHAFECAARAARALAAGVRAAAARALPVARHTQQAAARLTALEKRIMARSGAVEKDIEKFIDSYIRSVEEHRHTLHMQLMKGREIKLQALQSQTAELELRAENARDALQFAEDVLAEGTEVEVLGLVGPLLRRLEWCSDMEGLLEPRVSENLQLLKDKNAVQSSDDGYVLYGLIATQSVAPSNCVFDQKGLQNLRVHRKHEAILELRDIENQPMCHGGEIVTGFFLYCDANARPQPVHGEDKRDGTFKVSFTPDVTGHLQIAILVNNNTIKDSPFSGYVRSLRPHTGKYHCCTFCSTGGNKEMECGCGGSMGSGYKGCGHGHNGHPGGRHWSCCGNIQQNSECVRADSTIYQFSL